MLRGVRIRKDHRVNFPLVLVGFGGGLFVTNMAVKEKDDCLLTLNKISIKVEYVTGISIKCFPSSQLNLRLHSLCSGSEFAVIRHPDAPLQYHCYMNLLIDQPQFHLSLDTLWSLDDLLQSINEFISTFLGRWKSFPPTMSKYMIEVGILHALCTDSKFPSLRLIKEQNVEPGHDLTVVTTNLVRLASYE